ncbi:UvrD-helicase domain-containing protein [Actinoplanes hulinensis]|uniref:RecBCD enzyme subunit RecB n=1 Tax=Actinoplanes hulinensis TaxID=1144547 RepID=A0ABS7BEI4_9ACTN|nr:UvrD-helicase domain-containing protein [Actinoplanes hulinensis]MBW6439281.1 UvrD-helicase domain-containing protein [Actinoplanes hulinensis]
MTTATAFDVCGPLPGGTTVLEASAGTGKTFTIAALAARYVAEGTDLARLMLVTFGRAATAELRERVRERLVSAEAGLADPRQARASHDAVLARIADVDDTEAAHRRRRLATAVADFDAATIATTHQFCQQMRAGLGVAADSDPGAIFVDDLDDLVTEVVDDLYLRKYAAPGAPMPHFTRTDALTIARDVVHDGQARLTPADAESGSAAQARYRFAHAVRTEVTRRKRVRRLYGYDDMLTGLDAALTDPGNGPAACRRLRDRYAVVLVDEFQDTDDVQWNILRTAFHGHTTLVLIGDPKQAIYAFRGADVVSYLSAAGTATSHATLAVNWRSDQPLLTALDTVFGGAALGDTRITVHPVGAAHRDRRLYDAPVDTPLRIRVVSRDGHRLGKAGLIPAADARTTVATDVARDIAALLSSPARLAEQRIGPGDVAVLVRTNRQGVQVREALADAGVPAVLTGATSVFATPAARDWLALLEALEQPHRATRVAAAALTVIVGWSAQQLAEAAETDLDELRTTLRRWAVLLAQRGVAALLEAIMEAGLAARLLGRRSGERDLTDLRHIGLALHTAAVDGRLGPAAIVEWLRRRIDDADRDISVERSRRLESDADAVQILTVHVSKGLEFPVVYVPFGWDRYVADPAVPLLHDATGTRVRDVGGPDGPGFADSCRRHRDEDAGEDLRLLYVAMTRAKSQVVTWWAPTLNTRASALHRLLFSPTIPGASPPADCAVPDDTAALTRLHQLTCPHITVEQVIPVPPARWAPPAAPTPALAAATFARHLDTTWQRTSYSRLTAAAHDTPTVHSEPEHPHHDDEAIPAVPATTEPPAPAGVPSPMADLPSGAAFGTLVHAVLETTDPTATDLLAELTDRATQQLVRQPARVEPDVLAAALQPALRTPLGPLAGHRCLADIAPADRLTELDFELPLDGGDRPRTTAPVTLATVGRLIGRHLHPGDPLTGYPALLQTPDLGGQRLRGYLAGSIDAVLRVPTDDGTGYLVVDYKTNWLGDVGPTGPAPLTTTHYRPAALTRAMTAAHYPLQALLYAVALHRYLRWRQPGYQPHQQLAGVLYLFLRGMCGPDTPVVDGTPCGVFSWRPPAALVEELSALLDGNTP